MLRFKDRADAGNLLAKQLMRYAHDPNVIVLGLPRGGVVTAYYVAKVLHVLLDIIISRKIGAPGSPELAVGALTQEGEPLLNEKTLHGLGLKKEDLEHIIAAEKREVIRRLSLYRGSRASLNLKNKIVILIDDGIATGATMHAAIASVRKQNPQKIIVAVPVASLDTARMLEKEVDEVICLSIPRQFLGVGQFYDSFGQISDEEVIALLSR